MTGPRVKPSAFIFKAIGEIGSKRFVIYFIAGYSSREFIGCIYRYFYFFKMLADSSIKTTDPSPLLNNSFIYFV
jgi:hypothetical protein